MILCPTSYGFLTPYRAAVPGISSIRCNEVYRSGGRNRCRLIGRGDLISRFLDLSASISQFLVALFHLYPGDYSITIEFFRLSVLLIKLLNFTFVQSLEVIKSFPVIARCPRSLGAVVIWFCRRCQRSRFCRRRGSDR